MKTTPLLILTVARRFIPLNRRPNRHACHDVGLAMGNLPLQAAAPGLSVHQMAGLSAEEARVTLQLSKESDPVYLVAVSSLGDPEQLPEVFRSCSHQLRQL